MKSYFKKPVLILAALAITAFGYDFSTKLYKLRQIEKKVEGIAEEEYNSNKRLKQIYGELVPFKKSLDSESESVSTLFSQLEKKLDDNTDFFNKYCPSGNADKSITMFNVQYAFPQLQTVIERHRTALEDVENIIDKLKPEDRERYFIIIPIPRQKEPNIV